VYDSVARRSQSPLGSQRKMVVLGSHMCRIGTTTAAHISNAVVRSLHHRNRRDGICNSGISDGLRVRVHCREDVCKNQ